jgi:hypothetical protein
MAKAKSTGKSSGKPGPSSVDPASRGSNFAFSSGGSPGKSKPQSAIPGPKSPGQPIAMKRALAKKSIPNRGNSFPGLVK